MKKERNLYIDVLKAFSILLVVLGHCIQYGAGKEYTADGAFFANPVFLFIYSFHMPLFMLISGYLFAFSCKNKTWFKLLVAKAKQILIPLCGWCVVSTVIDTIKIICGLSDASFGFVWLIKDLYANLKGGPWFLWAMWCGVIAVIFVRFFLKDHPLAYVFICLASLLVPDSLISATTKFMLPFFIIAYYFNAHGFNVKLKKIYMHPAFIIGCTAAFISLIHLYSYDTYIYNSGFFITSHLSRALTSLHNNTLRFTVGFFGSISFMYLIYGVVRILPKVASSALAYLGTKTLGIYIISNYLFIEIVRLLPITGLNYGLIILETVIVTAVSTVLTILLQKFKYTNRIFLGGR